MVERVDESMDTFTQLESRVKHFPKRIFHRGCSSSPFTSPVFFNVEDMEYEMCCCKSSKKNKKGFKKREKRNTMVGKG
jgi:hypothetical protein